MARRTIRELSSPLFGLRADRETQKKWMRRGGKRRIRRMERHEAKRRTREEE